MFPAKDVIPKNLSSNVVYRFTCKNSDECNSSYIGSCIRRLEERICDHMGVSFYTGAKHSNPNSAVFDHAHEKGHRVTEECFEILGGCRSEDNVFMIESVYIKDHRPNLNNMDSAYPLQLT